MPKGVYRHKPNQLFQKGHIDLVPKESRQQQAEKLRGQPLALEHKLKIGLANKGNPSWIKGRHHLEETKRKISISHQGKKYPNISLAKKGMKSPWTAERNRLMSGDRS